MTKIHSRTPPTPPPPLDQPHHTVSLQAGLGLMPETLALLDRWQPGMTATELARAAVESGTFARATARRVRNLVAEQFAPRFLGGGGEVARRLQLLRSRQAPHGLLLQVCFLQTARANAVFHDYLREVLWPRVAAGWSGVRREDGLEFLERSMTEGRSRRRWSASVVRRVASYLAGCAADFGLLGPIHRGERPFQPFSLRADAALYLAYDLHLQGLGDDALCQHADWSLFGLAPADVLTRLRTLGAEGHCVVQSSGEMLRVAWTYSSMKEVLHVLAP